MISHQNCYGSELVHVQVHCNNINACRQQRILLQDFIDTGKIIIFVAIDLLKFILHKFWCDIIDFFALHVLICSRSYGSEEKEASGEATGADRWHPLYHRVSERSSGGCSDQH